MKKVLRLVLSCALACLLAGVLGGCGLFKPIESLYVLPALPQEYAELQAGIDAVVSSMGAEYATIGYGNNTSTIQLLDMDGDGVQETAAVFLRVSAAEESKPLRVCLFRRGADGSYQLTHTLQGDGMTIHSVIYEDLTGDGVREMIVSWQMSAKVYALSAYQLSSAGTNQLMNTSYNERYLVVDLDGDSVKEIVVFQQRTSEDENNRAEYYRYQDGAMVMSSVAPLSATVVNVAAAEVGELSDGVSGIYATGELDNGVLTDILVLSDGVLKNITLDTEIGISQVTARTYTDVAATDINGDGIIETPLPVQVPQPDGSPAAGYVIYWRQFDSQGGSVLLANQTYHSITDGWYMTLPGSWQGKITVSRDDTRALYGERAVVFYYWPDTATTSPAEFLTVYRLTGDNRHSRAKLFGRVELYSDSSTIYCAVLNTDVWDCGVETASELIPRFHLITPEWSSQ